MFDWVKVETDGQIKELCGLAHEIWNEYSICFAEQEQIDYMLEKFQSFDAVKGQIDFQKYGYYFLEDDDENFGYFAVQPKAGHLFLSKIYIRKDYRGKGYARKALDAIIEIAKGLELFSIKLTVNKFNLPSIYVYEKLGFDRIGSDETDIGGGFIMDDYIYEYKI